MSPDRQIISFVSIRRIVLGMLTLFILFKLVFSLIGTLDRPQIQGKFELYQTNLVLVASEWKPTSDDEGLGALQTSIVGTDLLKSATEQYKSARASDVSAIEKLKASLADATATDAKSQQALKVQTNLVNQTIASAQTEIDKIDLRIGILQAARKQPEQAIATWQTVTNSTKSRSKNIAASLIDIWRQPSGIDRDTAPQIEAEITANFDGWFRDRVSQQLYTDLGDRTELAKLALAEQIKSKNALIQ